MKWEPADLARFARDGRFNAMDVPTAVAVAMATSNGISDYDARAGAPGAGHWQGLWGINTDRYDQYDGVDLHIPQVSAHAAHELFRTHGGWDWSPVYVAGRHLMHMARAGTERTRETQGRTPSVPFTLHDTDRRLARAYAELTMLRNQLRPVDQRMVGSWPRPTR